MVNGGDDAAVAVARTAFSRWLRTERERRGLSLDDIARVTKIQVRALERLEEARFDELPADVFVRGFIRNYARVVGVDADQALARYDACGVTPGPAAAAARARAMLETVSMLAPDAARSGTFTPEAMRAGIRVYELQRVVRSEPPVRAAGSMRMAAVEPAPIGMPAEIPAGRVAVAEPVEGAIKGKRSRNKQRRGDGKHRKGRRAGALSVVPARVPVAAVVETAAVVAREVGVETAVVAVPEVGVEIALTAVVETAPEIVVETAPVAEGPLADVVEDHRDGIEITIIADEPPAPVRVASARTFRARLTGRAATVAPTLVIDDEDPDTAEREQEARRDTSARRSFLPAALLDGDRGSRQGGLTLAVIILLIVATLTLSYLMRRPGSSGEGVTGIDPTAEPRRGDGLFAPLA